jgi:uncharacterized membrane protein
MSQAGSLNNAEIPFPPGDIPIEFVTNSGTAMAIANILQVKGVGGVTVSAPGSSNLINIAVSVSGFTWNEVTDATNPNQIVAENGYLCYGSSLVTFLLPLVGNDGDTFKIFSVTSRFQIIPNGSQKLVIGAVTGLIGAMGTATSNSPGDEITITYMGNNTWQSEPPQGTITVVTS